MFLKLLSRLVLILIILLLFVLVIRIWKYRRYYYLGFQIPGISPWRNVVSLIQISWVSLEKLNKVVADLYLESFRLNYPMIRMWLGTKLIVVFSDPQLIKKIFQTQLQKDPQLYMLVDQVILGPNILTENRIPKWKNHRRMIESSSFNVDSIKSYINIMFEEANILADKLADVARIQQPFEPVHMVLLAAFAMIVRTFGDTEMKIQQNFHEEHPISSAVEYDLKMIAERIKKPWTHLRALWNLIPQEDAKRRKMVRDFTEEGIQSYKTNRLQINNRHSSKERTPGISDRKENSLNNTETFHLDKSPQVPSEKSPKQKSFFKNILQNQMDSNISKENLIMSHDDFVSESMTMFGTGFDTSTKTMSVMLILLALHPEIQQDIYEEIVSILGEDSHKIPSYNQLQELDTLNRVIKETLRLYPPVHMMARQTDEEIQVGKYIIPKGVGMYAIISGLHRDPFYWPEPDKFIPDRFLPSAAEGSEFHSSIKAYLPFSTGPRNCIGQKYALVQMKLIMITLLRRYLVLPGDKCRSMGDIRIEIGLTINLVNGANDIRLQPRNQKMQYYYNY